MMPIEQPRALPRGVWIQVYLGAIRGASHAARLDAVRHGLDDCKAAGAIGIVWHTFTTATNPDQLAEYAALAAARGLLSCVSWGLDATDGAGKGRRMAACAQVPGVLATGVDAEGAFDSGKQAVALAMGEAFVHDAGEQALVIDQSWPVPTVHSSFPYEQFAGFVDAHGRYTEFVDLHAEQRYCNDWKRQWGAARFAKCEALFDASEATLERILPPEARRPHIRTIQANGWDDIGADLDACLAAHDTVWVWADDGFPHAWFYARLRMAVARGKTPAVAPV